MSEENAAEEAGEATLGGVPQEPPGFEEEHTQKRLDEALSKIDDYRDQVLRLQAELENGRRRAARDVENAHKYALERFSLELLPVRDSLELALQAIGAESELDQLREGTELTLKMLTQAMEKFGIVEVDSAAHPVNPALLQAMTMQESAEQPPNTVLSVMQKGYTLNERLIRPAMVVVSKAAAES